MSCIVDVIGFLGISCIIWFVQYYVNARTEKLLYISRPLFESLWSVTNYIRFEEMLTDYLFHM